MKITRKEYQFLLDWIKQNFIRSDSYNHHYDSGRYRTAFEQDPNGFYIDADTFKQAMIDCGYVPFSKTADYWEFTISENSPALIRLFGRNREYSLPLESSSSD